jgi:hypothetical protein
MGIIRILFLADTHTWALIFRFAFEFSAVEEDRNFSPILNVPYNLP